jgi:hypothetical protein
MIIRWILWLTQKSDDETSASAFPLGKIGLKYSQPSSVIRRDYL